MLVLSRKAREKIIIGDDIVITVLNIYSDKIRLGIEAPRDVEVDRGEVREAKVNMPARCPKCNNGWISGLKECPHCSWSPSDENPQTSSK